MKFLKNISLLFLLFYCSVSYAQQSKRIALLIGNSTYEMYSDLAGIPHNDVDILGGKLEKLGFRTMIFKDLGKDSMNQVLNNFIDTIVIQQYEVALFAYSGHGGQSSVNDDFLIPVKLSATVYADDELAQHCISFSSIVDKMNSAKCLKHRIILYDACRNVASLDEKNGLTDGAQKNLNTQGFIISYSVSSGGKAYNELMGKRLSPYIIALLRHIENMESVEMILLKTHNDVLQMTDGKQSPYIGIGGNENGVLYLNGEHAPMDFIKIDGQNLRMGSEDVAYQAAPIVETRVEPFFIQACPVNNEAFVFFLNTYFFNDLNNGINGREFYKNNIHALINIGDSKGIKFKVENGRRFFEVIEGLENYPVTNVSWEGANKYANWKNSTDSRYIYALPKEKHWECWADRNAKTFKGNDRMSVQANTKNAFNDGAMCHPFGNIIEWTADVWIASYKRNGGIPIANEQGITVKGCSYAYNKIEECHPAYRRGINAKTRKASLGFRLIYIP